MTSTRFPRLTALVVLAAVSVLPVAACSRTGPVQPYAEDATVNCPGKQALTASGSTAQANAMTHFADAFQAA